MIKKILILFLLTIYINFSLTLNITTVDIKDVLEEHLNKTSEKHLQLTLINLIKKAENENGVIKLTRIIQDYLDDPFKIENFNVSKESGFTKLNANFTNLWLYGLKNILINKVKLNLAVMKINVELVASEVKMIGYYNLKGKLTFIPVEGNGSFSLNITDLKILGLLILNRNENGLLKVSNINIDAEAGDLNIYFDNLLGGSWSSFSNTLLNELSGLIFDRIKTVIGLELEKDLRLYFDNQLQNFKIDVINQSESLFDDYINTAKDVISKKGFDPFILPNRTEKIGNQLLYYILNGEIKLFNGQVKGLSSLRRTGDVIVSYENDSLIFEGNFGFENLLSKYSWSGTLFDLNNSGMANISIKIINGYIKILQPLKKNANPIILDFKIVKLNQMWVDVNGLGKWDSILEIIVNLVSNTYKKTIMDLISGPAKTAVQNEFNNLKITW